MSNDFQIGPANPIKLKRRASSLTGRSIGTTSIIAVFIEKQLTGVCLEQNAFVARDSSLDGDLNCQRICER